MPNTISVSPAQPNKLVVNGCDLVNQPELSISQNRELQRYIDANAHLLGFLDKFKDETEDTLSNKNQSKNNSFDRHLAAPVDRSNGNVSDNDVSSRNFDKSRAIHSLNCHPSPASSEYLRKKGVSWLDSSNQDRALSNSPKKFLNNIRIVNQSLPNAKSNYQTLNIQHTPNLYNVNDPTPGNNELKSASSAYLTSDKRRTSFDNNNQPLSHNLTASNRQTQSPWGNTSAYSRDSRDTPSKKENWKGFHVNEIPVYISLEQHPDNYNRYETHRYREHQLQNTQEQPEKKFYGYGDHKVSGIELQHKPWTGGEIITDPNFLKKSIKPRRVYYSPIGDGVVEADGIELRRGPKDMTPRVTVCHEKYVKKGSGGKDGLHLLEETWSDGAQNKEAGERNNKNLQRPAAVAPNTNSLGRRFPHDNGNNEKNEREKYMANPPIQLPNVARPLNEGFPLEYDDLNSVPKSRKTSALSIGTNSLPREGWTKTFIVNPRELINQYANETQTIIFDLEDHTPKLTTTIKQTISQSPAPFLNKNLTKLKI